MSMGGMMSAKLHNFQRSILIRGGGVPWEITDSVWVRSFFFFLLKKDLFSPQLLWP